MDRAEDSPQSGEEEKPEGGVDSFQVCVTVGRKGVTFLFVEVEGCQERADHGRGGVQAGSLRVLWGHPLLSSHSQLQGPGRVGGRGHQEDSSPMMYTPQACRPLGLELNAHNEADTLVNHRGVAAQHG